MTHEPSGANVAPSDPAHCRQGRPVEDLRFFTTAQVAEMVGVSTRTVRRWIKNRQVVAHHIGATVRIAESDLKVFFSQHRGK